MRTTRRWHVLYAYGPFHAHISFMSPDCHTGEVYQSRSAMRKCHRMCPVGAGCVISPAGRRQCRGAVFLLANQRFCHLLPPQFRVLPTPGLRAIGGTVDRSCTSVCEYVRRAVACICHATIVQHSLHMWFPGAVSFAVPHPTSGSSTPARCIPCPPFCNMSARVFHEVEVQIPCLRRSFESIFLARRAVQCN